MFARASGVSYRSAAQDIANGCGCGHEEHSEPREGVCGLSASHLGTRVLPGCLLLFSPSLEAACADASRSARRRIAAISPTQRASAHPAAAPLGLEPISHRLAPACRVRVVHLRLPAPASRVDVTRSCGGGVVGAAPRYSGKPSIHAPQGCVFRSGCVSTWSAGLRMPGSHVLSCALPFRKGHASVKDSFSH